MLLLAKCRRRKSIGWRWEKTGIGTGGWGRGGKVRESEGGGGHVEEGRVQGSVSLSLIKHTNQK